MPLSEKILIKDFNFFYGANLVLKDINLRIKEKQILAILGPARSGKTTLLKSINRLTDLIQGTKHTGHIFLDQKDIYDPSISLPELRRKVGMVFDLPTPLPLSIFENVAYGPRLQGIRRKEILAEIVENALRAAALWDEVKDRLFTSAFRLSGGQQQRLCIARVLALNPEVILLDEPCSGLDPISTRYIEETLFELKKRYTIIIVPHNIQQASRLADQVAFFLEGELIEEGPVELIFTKPRKKITEDYLIGKYG